jgi:hypothetical protein
MPKSKIKKMCDKCKRKFSQIHKYKNEMLCTNCFNSKSNDNFCNKTKIKSMSEFFSLMRLRRRI